MTGGSVDGGGAVVVVVSGVGTVVVVVGGGITIPSGRSASSVDTTRCV